MATNMKREISNNKTIGKKPRISRMDTKKEYFRFARERNEFYFNKCLGNKENAEKADGINSKGANAANKKAV